MNVLVTGGARGLGREISKYFASNGYNVIVNYNNSYNEALSLQKEFNNIEIVKADISNEDEVKKMFDGIPKLDILINNAGISLDKDPLSKTYDDFKRVIDVNLIGTFLCIKYASNVMSNGSIVNISSTNAINTYYPESMDYDASKAGVISLTHNFAKYFNDIRVNCICPDWIDTDMNLDMDMDYKNSLGKFLDPKDVAKLVFEVANSKMNDRIIRVGDNSAK